MRHAKRKGNLKILTEVIAKILPRRGKESPLIITRSPLRRHGLISSTIDMWISLAFFRQASIYLICVRGDSHRSVIYA